MPDGTDYDFGSYDLSWSDPGMFDPSYDNNGSGVGAYDPVTGSFTGEDYAGPGGWGGNPNDLMNGLGNGLGSLAGVPWGSILQTLGGLSGYTTSKAGIDQIQGLITSSDPWAPARPEMGARLQEMMRDPQGTVGKTPGFQAGLEGVERSMAANGYLGSGNMMAALEQYGADTWYKNADLLSRLSGANASPGNNSAALMQVLGQAESGKNASIANILSGAFGTAKSMTSGANRGGGGGGDDSGLGDLGSIASLALAFL